MTMKRKWASCSTRGRVCFAEDVLALKGLLRDYIIVHELLHLKIPNHSRLFKSLLSAHLPECRQAQKELDVYSVERKLLNNSTDIAPVDAKVSW